MSNKLKQEAQNPLILRCHRLMEAFAKADDERDFFLDRAEGYLIFVDLDKTEDELNALYDDIEQNANRYCQIPKLTFYETKKIMEGFVNEKVYDIDTKEKLLDIIQSKEARENFLEYVYDHHSEFEKWQQYYQERSRIRIIEWLRNNNFHFVFEEDLDLAKTLVEKLKLNLFETKVGKDILTARKALFAKAKTYYSNEALNPRPKRGRPPKQAIKQEIEPQFTGDFYISVSPSARPFLYIPEHHGGSAAFTFSSKFESEEALLASRKHQSGEKAVSIEEFKNKLASLKNLSSGWTGSDENAPPPAKEKRSHKLVIEDWDDEDDNDDDDEVVHKKPMRNGEKKEPPKKPVTAKKAAPVASKKAPAALAKKGAAAKKAAPSKGKEATPPPKGRPVGSTKKKRIIPRRS
ncbi:MAG: UPF0158 family protein [Parachlamydiales bacterium]|jgi:hypothetical protein